MPFICHSATPDEQWVRTEGEVLKHAHILVVGLLAVMLYALPAHAEKRVALVIGNSGYKSLQSLPNPRNDAILMVKTLRQLGFKVIAAFDANRTGIGRAIKSFGKALGAGGRDAVGLFYFAGHGVQARGQNYLIPLGAQIQTEDDLQLEAITTSTVLSRMETAGNALNLVILDACRNNPFKGRFRSVSRGLARVQATRGSLIAFSAGPGEVAADGVGLNSPYTSALVKAMAVPGLAVEQMFKRVRVAVEKATGGEQTPWEESSLRGDFYFKPAKPLVAPQPPLGEAAKAWRVTKDTSSIAVLNAFIKQFPKSIYATFGRARIKELKGAKVAVGVFPKKTPVPSPARRHKPGDIFKDCKDCPEMVVIPKGSFIMGTQRPPKAGPLHRVTIRRAFAVGKFEITVDQFAQFVHATRHNVGNTCTTYERSTRKDPTGQRRMSFKDRSGRSFRKPGFPQAGSQPAVCVSWHSAQAYVAWLSVKARKTYRLLSEAEWEYAARAGTKGPFATGPRITTDQANFNGNFTYNGSGEGRYRGKTVTAGSFPANAFGIHDMHGNVWEWVKDCHKNNYRRAPTDGSPAITGKCIHRVLRGGSWNNSPGVLQSAYRVRGDPRSKNSILGFRVARTITP